MKNEINTGQFHVKTGFLINGWRNLISTFVNTKTESHKYENGRTKIENRTDRNGNISVRFQPYWGCNATGGGQAAKVAGADPAAAGSRFGGSPARPRAYAYATTGRSGQRPRTTTGRARRSGSAPAPAGCSFRAPRAPAHARRVG